LLRKVKACQNFPENQRYLLIQLSVYELVNGVLFLVIDSIKALICYGGVHGNTEFLADTKKVLVAIIDLPSYILFIVILLAITMDRLLSVYLNIRYPLICTLRRGEE